MRARRLLAAGVALFAVSCSSSTSPAATSRPSLSPAPTATTEFPPPIDPYEVTIDPADFAARVDNELFPLFPGYSLVYEGTSDGERERDVVKVTEKTKTIMGVDCTVVSDIVSSHGKVTEKTFDWYAQDVDGNVWYFGEDSTEYDNGKPSTKGSWEAGVDGALPGIMMLADPHPGDEYRQEYAAGEAEDIGKVVDLSAPVSIPLKGAIGDALVTEDSSLVERGVAEHKYYVSGIGVVMERSIEGPKEVMKLVDMLPRD